VVFGWILGIWLALVFAYMIRDPIFEHVDKVVQCAEDDEILKRNAKIFGTVTCSMTLVSLTIYLSCILQSEQSPR